MRGPIAVITSGAMLGGGELSLIPVVERLARERPVVAFLPAPGPLTQELESAGARVATGFELPQRLRLASHGYGIPGGARTAVDVLRQQVRLARALRRLRPGLVYCNGYRAQMGATAPALVAGADVAWHVRDFSRGGLAGQAWARLARNACLLVANSAATADDPAFRGLVGRVVTIHNGVDLQRFRPRSGEPDQRVIGMAAHLTPWKGHERFLRLLARIRLSMDDVRGRIAGAPLYDTAGNRGAERWVADAVARLGLAEACSVEAIAHDAMPAWFAGLSVLVHCPDRPEPFGRSLAEGLAVGVPVVLAGHGGAVEVVNGAGVVVGMGDEEALFGAVAALLADRDQRQALGRLGPPRAAAHFDERRYADRVAAALLAL